MVCLGIHNLHNWVVTASKNFAMLIHALEYRDRKPLFCQLKSDRVNIQDIDMTRTKTDEAKIH